MVGQDFTDEFTPVGIFDAGFPERFDEWQHRVTREITSESPVSVSGAKFDATTQPYIDVYLTEGGKPLPERVQLLPLQDGRCWVQVASSPPPRDAIVELAAGACGRATAGMGGRENFRWSALLTLAPGGMTSGTLRLQKPVDVGPFRLESSGQLMSEPTTPSPGHPSLGAFSLMWSVPMRLRGTSSGWSFASASETGAADLALLCSVLSVAWNECIVPRTGLQPEEFGELTPPATLLSLGATDSMTEPYPYTDVHVPTWCHDSWERLSVKPWLAHAVRAFREGLRASTDHPSLGFVGLTATIEAIAGRLFQAERCDECGARRNIAAGFRAATALVLPAEEGSELVQAAYGPRRSKTVHEGRLHSHELSEGAWRAGFWAADASTDFLRVLLQTRMAARQLCLLGLRDELPQKRALTKDELARG
jgi:hypothetical protein